MYGCPRGAIYQARLALLRVLRAAEWPGRLTFRWR